MREKRYRDRSFDLQRPTQSHRKEGALAVRSELSLTFRDIPRQRLYSSDAHTPAV